MTLALAIFIVMYVLLLKFMDYRYLIALGAAILFLICRLLTPIQAFYAINWNIIMMLSGTMMVVELFIKSQMPTRLSEKLLRIVPDIRWAVVVLSLFSGVISAFVDNVATVLMVAPVALAVSKQLKINPVPVIISIAVSSNLQGAATLVGDTTSILLGEYAKMSFNDFFWFLGKLGIFFSVELGALMTVPVLLYLFRKEKAPVSSEVHTVVTDHVPSVLMVSVVLGLIIASQFPNRPDLTNGYICLGLGIVGIVYECIRLRGFTPFVDTLHSVDYETLLLLCGLFVVIEGITQAGVIDKVAELFVSFGGTNIFLLYTLIVFVSVVISAFVDNIPYVATMLPVVSGIASLLGCEPYVLFYGLLIGATLGGNLTPVGASANIAGIGILRKNGHEVTTKDFLVIGIPFTLVAVLTGYLFTWFIWA